MMKRTNLRAKSLRSALLGGAVAAAVAGPALAADVTMDRLVNAGKEPQNWLMQNQSFEGWNWSALKEITKDNVKNLRVAFAVPITSELIGTLSPNNSGRPLVDGGMMYYDDGWGMIYKVDASSGKAGKILWTADGAVSKDNKQISRGVTMWGNSIYHSLTDGRMIAVNRDTGEITLDTPIARLTYNGVTNVSQQKEIPQASMLAIKGKLIIGNGNGDAITRGWLQAVDAETGKILWRTYMVPGPGEPGHETWKGDNEVWKVGGAAPWTSGTYDPVTNVIYQGTGNAQPMFDVEYRPGDNLYAASVVAMNADTGKILWHFQFIPNEGWDYDENSLHQVITVPVNGTPTKILGHWSRGGHLWRLRADGGQFIDATAYTKVTWTAGIDPKTGKPVEYDPKLAVQAYLPAARPLRGKGEVLACPSSEGGIRFASAAFNPNTYTSYATGMESCYGITVVESKKLPNGDIDPAGPGGIRGRVGISRYINPQGLVIAADMSTNKVTARKTYPHEFKAGIMSTAGGVVYTVRLTGEVIALDEKTLDELWSFSTGMSAKGPPISYSVNGKQYIAAITAAQPGATMLYPGVKNLPHGAMLWVFTL
jgi:alcohol dehydrogenase (cytochrome c)